MPNWVFNTLSISGPAVQISALKEQVGKPFSKTHENWNMETKQMEFKEYKYSKPIFAFHNIYNHLDDGVTDEVYRAQPEHTSGQSVADMFSGNDWYSWNVRNWGTKWDVAVSDDDKYSDTYIIEEDDTSIAYHFNTAWSPPTEIIAILSARYPNLEMSLSFEEETGWGGETEFEEGNPIEVEAYGWKCRECDHIENDTPYCEECEFDTCPSCGYNEADEACEQHKEGNT